MRLRRATILFLCLAVCGLAAVIPWEDLTEGDWIYALATRFALVDGHRVHYPTPTAELARLLEGERDTAALRHLAEARLALGDRGGALEAMQRWAQAQGPQGWAELARWAAAHQEPAAALAAAERALAPGDGAPASGTPGAPAQGAPGAPTQGALRAPTQGALGAPTQGALGAPTQGALGALAEPDRRSLADERIQWAVLHPELADPIALRQARAALFPRDGRALEFWVRSLERAGRLAEAEQALAGSQALGAERKLLLISDLKADHGDLRGAFKVLDDAADRPWGMDFRKAYAARVDQAAATAPAAWRATLDTRFDAPALVRLATYFQGRDQGGAALDLLRQVERRHGQGLARPDNLLLARLYGEIDAVPEAFREALAAAHAGSPAEQTGDLAGLADLALRAGGRPLAWGNYNDETYHWVASVDRTPGFWTGGVAFLLTGVEWKETLARLEDGSVPDRTFATARALADLLARRAPVDAALPALRVAIMERHVERGEGQAALDLLPLAEAAPPEVADQARRVALLALQQVSRPLSEEAALFKARLKFAAPDGSRPALSAHPAEPADPEADQLGGSGRPWARVAEPPAGPAYPELLNAAVARLDTVDPGHRAALDLILAELDRLPDAEDLWLDLAARLEGWNLDDALGPRYQQALQRFQDPGIWAKAARWYARRNYQAELRQLAADVAARFRGAALFQRADAAPDVLVQAPGQPAAGRVRLVAWADWVRFKALERFPHSPEVFREAGRLITESQWAKHHDPVQAGHNKVVVPDALVEDRRWAILFADPGQREAWFAEAMRQGTLEARLEAMEARTDRSPVDDLLLFEGWARLSRFERAAAPADRLALCYPGDGALAQRVLALHRSLNGLAASHFEAAKALVERTAPALEDPNPLWTELGEMEEERGRPDQAMELWRNLLAREPRDPARIAELATLLWDYNHDQAALAVVEAGRKALGRPRFFAFETGVLRENLRDLDGAVREYLDAVRPEDPDQFDSWFERDQRSLRRLAQLLAKEPVFRSVASKIQALAPGSAEDERELAAFYPLGTIELPDPGLEWDADRWIDAMDQPNDALGQAARKTAREGNRPDQAGAIRRMGDLLLAKLQEMVPKATSAKLLDFAEGEDALQGERFTKDQKVTFRNLVMARRAQLAPGPEQRITLEVARAQYLASNGRTAEADGVWAGLARSIGQLPEGTVRMQAEAQRAGYLERTQSAAAAGEEWRRLGERYPWSLGLLEDRLAFLQRAGLAPSGRALLEEAAGRAGPGYREELLQRLTREALAASDLAPARRAVDQLLAQGDLAEDMRLRGIHLLARLSFRTDPGWDPQPLAKAQEPLLKPELRADLHHELAQAADEERAPALALWIEALNRRTERAWLVEAARSAAGAGKGPELLDFFRKQRDRSPRDVRWAVAVRDILRAYHDVDGAVAAAKAVVKVRPEDPLLWKEAADILVRADRVREAADFLGGWNRPRPADEGVAGWRSGLYVRCGDPARALAVEQEALAAYAREGHGKAAELAERKARAASRLLGLGRPELALQLLSPRGDVADLARSKLDSASQAQLALLTGGLPRLLEARSGDAEFLPVAGGILADRGRPDQKEAVQARLAQLLDGAGARPAAAALKRWWPFVGAAGLEPGLRVGLAQRLAEQRPGPWQTGASFPFLARVGDALIDHDLAVREPDLSALWCQDLARRGRDEELAAFVAPRWQDLLARVKGTDPVSPDAEPLPLASWLQDPQVLQAWARSAAARPGLARELGEVMAERRLWDRFWALAARRWQPEPLLAVLSEGDRTAWFRLWAPEPRDPVLLARRRTVEQVSLALGRLLQGTPGADRDPLVARLRGPRTVGEVLGRDERWSWPEFAPRAGVQEQGDDRVLGQGADRGRLPGALWGERPGEAWYVLEALARYRQGDADAPLLPLASPRKGIETPRAILAVRLARAMQDLPLALDLAAADPGAARDPQWLAADLALLTAADRKDQAAAVLGAYVRAVQPGLAETGFLELSALAASLGLPAPLTLLDPRQPVGPVLLAYLQDTRPGAADRFTTANPTDFRTALANRWQGHPGDLSATQLRFWLRELWSRDLAPLPPEGLGKLGRVWPGAVPWLRDQAPPERLGALQALEQALTPAVARPALLEQLARPGAGDPDRLLAVRIRLARGETGPALALVDGLLADLRQGRTLAWADTAPAPAPDAEEADEDAPAPAAEDPLVARLRAWLEPFRAVPGAEPVAERFRTLLAERRHAGPVSAAEWTLALQLSPATQTPALAGELDEAWFRGEVGEGQLGGILEAMAATAPAEAIRWLARWPGDGSWAGARQRAAVLIAGRQPALAGKALLESRRGSLWTAKEEVLAYDLWRKSIPSAAAPAPAYWQGAMAAKGDPELGARLKAHPHDVLSARSALRALAPLAEDTALRAALVLRSDRPWATTGDDLQILALRCARGLLPGSPGAARGVLGGSDPGALARLLARRRFKAADIDAALADLARIAARAGDEAGSRAVLAVLAERSAPGLAALAAELKPGSGSRVRPFHLVDGKPAPIRPRDLTWAMLAQVLQQEGAP